MLDISVYLDFFNSGWFTLYLTFIFFGSRSHSSHWFTPLFSVHIPTNLISVHNFCSRSLGSQSHETIIFLLKLEKEGIGTILCAVSRPCEFIVHIVFSCEP